MARAVRERAEREPICGLCWAERRIVPLEYLPSASEFMCPWCGARVQNPVAADDDEDDIAAASFWQREGWDPKLSGRPPWQTGLHQTRAELPRGSRPSGRRRKKDLKKKRWYQYPAS